MKKKFALATVTAVTTLLFFVGCGVRVTNISVPDVAWKTGTAQSF